MDKIFREYDIRGIYGEDLNEDLAFKIGCAFGTLLRRNGKERSAVARDGRESSPALFKNLVRGLEASGIGVLDIGICPTPLLYFSLFHYPVGGGVMITASHNPGEYNGFKLCVGRESLHGEGIQDIKKMIQAGDFVSGKAPATETEPVIPAYLDYIKNQFKGVDAGGIKVVVDSGNGMGGLAGPAALKEMGC
ncbi:MAG TPA: phosphomannomutase, partial [Nitrospiria bacterium]